MPLESPLDTLSHNRPKKYVICLTPLFERGRPFPTSNFQIEAGDDITPLSGTHLPVFSNSKQGYLWIIIHFWHFTLHFKCY